MEPLIIEIETKILNFLKFICSKRYTAIYLQSLHYMLPTLCSSVVLFHPKLHVEIVLFFSYIFIIAFFLFEGCLLFKFDKYYFNEDVNMSDPLLDLLNLEINEENRMDLNGMLYVLGVISAMSIYIIRFG